MSGNNYGDEWAWESSRENGYCYPVDAHLTTRNSGGANPADREPWPVRIPRQHPLAPFKVAVLGAALATAATLGLAVLTAAPAAAPAMATPTATTPVFTAPTLTLDPYSDTGDWKVGTDLPPGVYVVTVTGELGGYYARCADRQCTVGSGLIANDVLDPGDSTVLDIKPTDYMVRMAGVRLTPA